MVNGILVFVSKKKKTIANMAHRPSDTSMIHLVLAEFHQNLYLAKKNYGRSTN